MKLRIETVRWRGQVEMRGSVRTVINGEDEDVDHFNYIAVCICSRIEMSRVMKGMVERQKEMKDDERAWLARVLNRACRNGSVRGVL